jgi:serine/threonine-protein kinase
VLQPGSVLAGKYRVERVLGEGGMGFVVEAQHLQLEERVAIKVPRRHILSNPDAVTRFVREARAAVRIKSEYVARVNDVGTLDSGQPYIVMEYLEGLDLASWLEKRGPFAVERAVEFVLQACEALAEAHMLGIVHRDLKPANLFCTRRADGLEIVKVLDFGISKVNVGGSVQDASMTHAGAIMGSPFYMSPEQSQSARSVDARSDIWAIGVILYELFCGRPPFYADTLVGLGAQIANAIPDPIRAFRLDVPPALEQVILRCLEKDRAQRYLNVAELAIALMPFAPPRAHISVERIGRVIGQARILDNQHPAPVPEVPGLNVPARQHAVQPNAVQPYAARSWPATKAASTPTQAHSSFEGHSALDAQSPRRSATPHSTFSNAPVSSDPRGSSSRASGLHSSRERQPTNPLLGWGLGAGAAAIVGIGLWSARSLTSTPPQVVSADAPAMSVQATEREAPRAEPQRVPSAPRTPAPQELAAPSPIPAPNAPVPNAQVAAEALVTLKPAGPTSTSALASSPPNAAPPTGARPKINRVKAPTLPAAPAPRNDCQPNYYFDANGDKHFKAQCF